MIVYPMVAGSTGTAAEAAGEPDGPAAEESSADGSGADDAAADGLGADSAADPVAAPAGWSAGGAVASATAAAAPATMLSAVMLGSSGARIGTRADAVAATSGTVPGSKTIEYTRTGEAICTLFRSTSTPGSGSAVRMARVCRSPSLGWTTVGDQSSSQSALA